MDAVQVAVIGGGPAGLMAAEAARAAGAAVALFDAQASVGRKILIAGKGGLNLTHAEPYGAFVARYGARRELLEPHLNAFGPAAVRAWAQGLGVETVVGSSRRVFPSDFKAAPLLRAWRHRLSAQGIEFHMRHRWCGWSEDGALVFVTPQGVRGVRAQAGVLALGGGSWPRLGADGAWVTTLREAGIAVAPLRPTNCGFDVGWSPHFQSRHAGRPVKQVDVRVEDLEGIAHRHRGEFVITRDGVEGGVIYASSAPLRELLAARGVAVLHLDLAPDRPRERLERELVRPRGRRTVASCLKRHARIDGVKAGLLREFVPAADFGDPARLAAAIKDLALPLRAPRPLEEAISSAGGVAFDAVDAQGMLRARPGVFCAGEMLDWEAPTGGYLLTACFATGFTAGRAAAAWASP